MKRKIIFYGKRVLSLILVISMAGCSLVDGRVYVDERDKSIMADEMQAVVIDQWNQIEPYLDQMAEESRDISGTVDPNSVIENLLQEENGETYLAFCHTAAVGDDPDELLRQAREILPQEMYNDLLADVDTARRSIDNLVEEGSREIQEEYREDFMRDMQQLVTRSVVLLTAAAVYACIPHFLIFGKISAAAAISVAAGALAATVMSIWRFYEFGGDLMPNFEEWLESVTSEPNVSYAMATSIISMATSMELSPVSCGIILGVFAIYQAVDMLRTMIEVYEL